MVSPFAPRLVPGERSLSQANRLIREPATAEFRTAVDPHGVGPGIHPDLVACGRDLDPPVAHVILPLTNDPLDYPWGSRDGLARVLGRTPSGRPEAEMWFGTHASSPSRVRGHDHTLSQVLSQSHEVSPGFLLKVLSAGSPLSIQVHPTEDQARLGFDRENAAGLDVRDPARNYRDPSAKPEIILAVGETFEALCGFRPIDESVAFLGRMADVARRSGNTNATEALTGFADVLDRDGLVAAVTAALTHDDIARHAVEGLIAVSTASDAPSEVDSATVRLLTDAFGHDTGILTAVLMNRVTLQPGEALFVDSGIVHAYLRGTGVEVMTSSDNVLRGGLTAKHLDVPEFLSVATLAVTPALAFPFATVGEGVRAFRPPVAAFQLVEVDRSEKALAGMPLPVEGPGTALGLGGALELTSSSGKTVLYQGQAFYLTAEEFPVSFGGSGHAVMVVPGVFS